MDELLAAAAAAMEMPERMVRRSAEARAKAEGRSVEDVLAEWAGVEAPEAAPAEEPTPEPAEEAPEAAEEEEKEEEEAEKAPTGMQAVIAETDPVGVAPEIVDHRLGATKTRLAVNVPLATHQLLELPILGDGHAALLAGDVVDEHLCLGHWRSCGAGRGRSHGRRARTTTPWGGGSVRGLCLFVRTLCRCSRLCGAPGECHARTAGPEIPGGKALAGPLRAPTRVGRVVVRGLTRTREHVVRRELPFRPGDPLSGHQRNLNVKFLLLFGCWAHADVPCALFSPFSQMGFPLTDSLVRTVSATADHCLSTAPFPARHSHY